MVTCQVVRVHFLIRTDALGQLSNPVGRVCGRGRAALLGGRPARSEPVSQKFRNGRPQLARRLWTENVRNSLTESNRELRRLKVHFIGLLRTFGSVHETESFVCVSTVCFDVSTLKSSSF